jgi:hypothetical protein
MNDLELHVFLLLDRLPDRDRWQKAIEDLELHLRLPEDLLPAGHAGECAVRLGPEVESSFAFETRGRDQVAGMPPELAERIRDLDGLVTFRWAGNPVDSACVMAAAAGLAACTDGIAFLPEEASVLGVDELVREYQNCLQ